MTLTMHLREQVLLRLAEAEVVSSPTADPVAPVEKEVRKSMERAAFLLGRMRGQQLRRPPPPPPALVSNSAQRIFDLTWNRLCKFRT